MNQEHESYNYEAEASVLGCVLIDSAKLKKIRELITSDDFYDQHNKLIFSAMEELNDNGVEVDLVTIVDKLKDNNLLDTIGGASHLVNMTSLVPTSIRALTYAKLVMEDSAKRKVTKAIEEIANVSKNGSTLDETLAKFQEKIAEVNRIGGKQNKYQVASMIDYVDEAQDRYKNRGKVQGLSTGFASIDKLTLGLVEGELIVVAGPTSKGKTLLSMSICNNIAKYGGRVLFVTLEMTKAELTSRYMFINGGPDTEEFNIVAANTIFQENDELDWKDIDGLIANAREELEVDIVVIDHLHYFARDIKNAAEELGKITMTFKKNAIRHKIPIILISHIRKMQAGEELSGEALRGSSLIAQDSDIVLLVNRDAETNQMGILIDKNRNRGKLSDRTPNWGEQSQRDIDTIYLEFNSTKLRDPTPVPIPTPVQQVFPGAVSLPYKQ